jgi:hypothetical protein
MGIFTPSESHSLDLDQLNLVNHAQVLIEPINDISKSLSGGSLQSHNKTFNLHSVLDRVKVILNGFGSQVSITYTLGYPSVCLTSLLISIELCKIYKLLNQCDEIFCKD